MPTEAKSREHVVFGDYELDCRTGELWRDGSILKLQPQPAKVLAILVGRAGEVVTRQELADQVWGSGTYVDFEHGVNYAIRQIRSVLADDPEQPRFLETIPKRGYRFIAPVNNSTTTEQALSVAATKGTWVSRVASGKVLYAGVAILLVAVLGTTWYVRSSWVSRSSANQIRSLAVLPLRNLSNDPSQEYFTDGMTDELITDLAKAGGLRVISHTSVERYKGTKLSLPEIARELGSVDAVVEGTVMRSGDRVRITAQLIDARSDRHLWADSYERDLRDVFSLQNEVAEQIAGEVGANLLAKRQPQSTGRVLDPVAYESYLRGNFYWHQLSCDGFSKARQYFEQTVNKDPEFARAYVSLAESYFTLADWGCSPDPTLVAKSKAAAVKALQLDPSLGEAHAWLGKLAFFYEWDLRKAENELAQAIELSPNYPEARMIHAVLLVSTDKSEQGQAEMRKAHDMDPISQLPNIIAIVVSYLDRRYDAAIEQGKKTIELYPESAAAYDWLGYAYEKKGLYDQAVGSYLKSKELQGFSPREISGFRSAYQNAGMRGFWQKELEKARRNSVTNVCWLAKLQAHAGNRGQALELLNQSFHQHCSGPHTTVAEPIFDDFRQDVKFREIAKQIGL